MIKKDDGAGRSGAQAIERALKVLDCFAACGPELALGQVAQRVQLPVSTVHRILQALTRSGYLRQTVGGYTVSWKVTSLARAAVPLDTQDAAPYLYALAAGLKLTVTLGVPDVGSVRTLVTARPPARWFCDAQNPSPEEPFHASALGKALLAFVSDDPRSAAQRLGALESFTSHTHTSAVSLAADLGQVRHAGFAVADEERTTGVRAVAVPVFGVDRGLLGAIGIQAMAERLTDAKVRELAAVLRQAAGEIGGRLGRRAATPR